MVSKLKKSSFKNNHIFLLFRHKRGQLCRIFLITVFRREVCLRIKNKILNYSVYITPGHIHRRNSGSSIGRLAMCTLSVNKYIANSHIIDEGTNVKGNKFYKSSDLLNFDKIPISLKIPYIKEWSINANLLAKETNRFIYAADQFGYDYFILKNMIGRITLVNASSYKDHTDLFPLIVDNLYELRLPVNSILLGKLYTDGDSKIDIDQTIVDNKSNYSAYLRIMNILYWGADAVYKEYPLRKVIDTINEHIRDLQYVKKIDVYNSNDFDYIRFNCKAMNKDLLAIDSLYRHKDSNIFKEYYLEVYKLRLRSVDKFVMVYDPNNKNFIYKVYRKSGTITTALYNMDKHKTYKVVLGHVGYCKHNMSNSNYIDVLSTINDSESALVNAAYFSYDQDNDGRIKNSEFLHFVHDEELDLLKNEFPL